jgi:hypothetical protein
MISPAFAFAAPPCGSWRAVSSVSRKFGLPYGDTCIGQRRPHFLRRRRCGQRIDAAMQPGPGPHEGTEAECKEKTLDGVDESREENSSAAPEVDWSKRRDPTEDFAGLDDEARAMLVEIDKFASRWIGTNVSRLYFYESLKSKSKKVQTNEDELQQELSELRDVLSDLEAMFDAGLIDKMTGDIAPAGWALVFVSFAAQVALVFALGRFLANALMIAFPPSPFG